VGHPRQCCFERAGYSVDAASGCRITMPAQIAPPSTPLASVR
jgi:hypothetical protein